MITVSPLPGNHFIEKCDARDADITGDICCQGIDTREGS